MRKTIASVLLVASLAFVGPAEADTFQFSFSNDDVLNPPGIGAGASGAVTGLIEGLPFDSGGVGVPASEVIIETIPATLTNTTGSVPIVINDSSNWNFGTVANNFISGGYLVPNSFTTVDGQITAVDFGSITANGSGGIGMQNGFIQNELYLSGGVGGDNTTVVNDNGFPGVTFNLVPEPSSLVLAFLGAVGLLLAARRRRR